MTESFPYGNDLAKVEQWIGRRESKSNAWHIQFLGGSNSLDDCEFHFLMHGLDSLTAAHCVLKGNGFGLPIGPRGFVSIPRNTRDVQQTIRNEITQDFQQNFEGDLLEGQIATPFLDTQAQSNVWRQCYNLSQEKQFMTRTTVNAFSLAELQGSRSRVEVVSSSFVVFQMVDLEFSFPGDEEMGLLPVGMGSGEANLSMPGTTAGSYACTWEVRSWTNNFYNRCPFRKGGENHVFTNNGFLHFLPPYTGYLYRTREDYEAVHPEGDYPFWQDLFPQLNESMEHFMDTPWAGYRTGGWVGDLPASYIAEYGP